MKFLDGLDRDIRESLLKQLRDQWTHDSTALEGNSLTLGETAFVLEQGLTVSGKPLKDHEEVVGHARAIETLYSLLERPRIEKEDLFQLHRAVQTERLTDAHRPVGGWKSEPNGTNATAPEGNRVFIEFSPPRETPALMESWMARFNESLEPIENRETALSVYSESHLAFTQIHPFFDGNGRVARLISNLPLLKAGFPPIVIPNQRRQEYLGALSAYSLAVGPTRAGDPIIVRNAEFDRFLQFCGEAWGGTWEIVSKMREKQAERNSES